MLSKTILSIPDWLKFAGLSPHEFSIQYPPRPEFFIDNFATEIKEASLPATVQPELLYIHVPFCSTKCSYCFFATDQRTDSQLIDSYLDALLKEIDTNPRLHHKAIRCLDIGGGTPTILSVRQLEKLLSRLSTIGIYTSILSRSIETTPSQLTYAPDKVKIIRDYGFDRVSVGVQTSNTLALGKANREQEWQQVVQAHKLIRSAGIQRLNIDLIFGLSGQSLSDWQNDIRRVVNLSPDSITTYDCLYRGKARKLIAQIEELPDLELLEGMYNWAYNYLLGQGYYGDYGSLNFSLHKTETGTSQYFERRLLYGDSYIGVGNYATSLIDNYWMFNCHDIDKYIKNVRVGTELIEYCYYLPPAEQYAKFALFSLNYGVLATDVFFTKFGCSLYSVYGDELDYAEQKGWIIASNGRVSIAPGKFAKIYFLRSLLYSHDAKNWFMGWCTTHEN